MKILIITNHMKVGGVQKSLLELLKVLAQCPEYEISLFCCKATGEFLKQVPKKVEILRENKYAIVTETTLSDCKKLGKKYYIFRLLSSFWSKCFTKALPAVVLSKLIGKIGEKYDVVISYSQPIEDHAFCNLTNEIALNCTETNFKITFVHCDFENYGGNTKRNRNLYKKFDCITAVSDSVGAALARCVPEVKDKIKTVYNFCDAAEIEALSNQNPLKYSQKAVVTVARLSEEKGIIRCIPIIAKLKEQNIDFEWHIVGGGKLENAIRKTIVDHNLENTVFLEGQQTNPYRYMKNADYLFLPSFHEAAPMVFDEAIVLKLPILTTNTLSAKELVSGRNAGIVCENATDGIYNMLYYALNAKETCFETVNLDMRFNMAQFDAVCKPEDKENECSRT